ncbi:riboflavin synthase subunit alpha [Patescibacteria group bacterium]|nr:riboflavin synthase subunit alpha [Patescibacteria group bacterium]
MFSGIVQGTREIVALEKKEGLTTFTLDLGSLAAGVVRGASVAVSGVCLTATDIVETHVSFDAMGETLAKTTIGLLQEGDAVNVERSVKIGDEIGGHRVSGHVAGMATITNVETPPNNWIVTFQVDPAWMQYLLPKGFVALDGCSLTIVDVGDDWFTVHLIPETLQVTTFGKKKAGDHVNLELDPETVTIVETVKRYLKTQ